MGNTAYKFSISHKYLSINLKKEKKRSLKSKLHQNNLISVLFKMPRVKLTIPFPTQTTVFNQQLFKKKNWFTYETTVIGIPNLIVTSRCFRLA